MTLDEIYERIPVVECKGLCHQACGLIPVHAIELERIEKFTPVKHTCDATTITCGWLTARKRCSVYAVRPFICRVYGAADDLPCPHGCRTSRMTSEEARSLHAKLAELSPQVELPEMS